MIWTLCERDFCGDRDISMNLTASHGHFSQQTFCIFEGVSTNSDHGCSPCTTKRSAAMLRQLITRVIFLLWKVRMTSVTRVYWQLDPPIAAHCLNCECVIRSGLCVCVCSWDDILFRLSADSDLTSTFSNANNGLGMLHHILFFTLLSHTDTHNTEERPIAPHNSRNTDSTAASRAVGKLLDREEGSQGGGGGISFIF